MSERVLIAARVVETIDRLAIRIVERFSDSHLGPICRQLSEVAQEAETRAQWIARPILSLRLICFVVVVGLIIGISIPIHGLIDEVVAIGVWNVVPDRFLEMLESTLNALVMIGAAIFFVITLESRIKRRRALAAIHELRSMAHIIDMHQLTKDPERVVLGGPKTASSPKTDLTPFELDRYLDYCSEMLSLVGKTAALYVQNFDDPVALASAGEVEALATGLSRKIWQKIMLLHTLEKRVKP